MTKINLKTKDKVKVGRKNKSAALCACNEEGYGCFALLRNDGILPLKLTKNLAILECKKSKSIATSRVLYKGFQQIGDAKQFVHVSHVLGQKLPKNEIKTTLKQLKKFSIVLMYIGNDVNNDIEELIQLAVAIKKHASVILCYHKTYSLLSSSLISCANAIFACFNKDKEDGKALCNLILGYSSPYARVCIDGAEPFPYTCFTEDIKQEYAFIGYGLSYVNFSYTNVYLSCHTAKIGEFINVEVVVTNNSIYKSSEIAQTFVTPKQTFKPYLVDYGKFDISVGESVTLSFTIDTSKLDYSAFESDGECEFYACIGKSSTDCVRVPFKVIF
ncbi:MAG: hypothetical protein J6C23_00555 [Clostridia bacterium]|nr:hypothetical protein [Clostridia bacterium]